MKPEEAPDMGAFSKGAIDLNKQYFIMKRKEFIKKSGLAGLLSFFSLSRNWGYNPTQLLACPSTITLSETGGPYKLDLSSNPAVWRSNVIESGQPYIGNGYTPLNVTLTIYAINSSTGSCEVLPNARVDFWHCNQHGYYSGFDNQNGYLGTKNYAGATWLRGIQTTDANGQVTFQTMFPGWYVGRVTHIHFEVYHANVLRLTSQLAFEDTLINTINGVSPYSSIPGVTPYGPSPTWHGQNTITNATDGVFSNGTSTEMLTITGTPPATLTGTLDVRLNYSVALSLDLLGFNAALNKGHTVLWWRTENERDFSHFEIQYSVDGEDFTSIAIVNGKGQSGETSDYSFEDPDEVTERSAYYRLKMVNNDGSLNYSIIAAVHTPLQLPIRVYPNPAKEYLIVGHPKIKGHERIAIISSDGREVATVKMMQAAVASNIDLENILPGAYYLVYFDGSDRQVVTFVKQ
jgi:protocatechuate 3,4-dioxygenase beta subunit